MGNYSVIIPVHNGEKYILATLISIDTQKVRPFEIIVVDDCSTDNTQAIVKNFAKNSHAQLKFIVLDTNSGSAAKPRNEGLKVVGDVQYIAFCDADDVWHIDKMFTQLELMDKKRSLFSFGRVKFFNKSSEISHQELPSLFCRKLSMKDFRFDNCVKSCSTAVISKTISQHCYFPEGIRYRGIEDYYCWLGILSKINVVDMISSELTFYRQHAASISSSKLSMIKLRFNTFNYKKNIFSKNSIYLPNIFISEIIYIFKQILAKL